MRGDFSLMTSTSGRRERAMALTPSSFVPLARMDCADGEAGIQIAPVPRIFSSSSFGSDLSQKTSQLAFSRRLIRMKELLTRWLRMYPAGFAGPVIELGGGVSKSLTF